MKKKILSFVLLLAAINVSAQEEVLKKYSALGDVNTISVTKGMLASLPVDQTELPLVGKVMSKIENMKILSSDKSKAAKELHTKLPNQLLNKGYEVKFKTKQSKNKELLVLQSETDPNSIVIVNWDKPKTIVVSLHGNFSKEDFEEQ